MSSYIKHWGLPKSRIVSRNDTHQVEMYSFPPVGKGLVHRIATVGASRDLLTFNAKHYEFLLTTSASLSGSSFDEAAAFIMDVTAHLEKNSIEPKVGSIMPETALMPKPWPARALLIDEPRGEAEELAVFHVGHQYIDLMWLVPIYQNEYDLISSEGMEAFDKLESEAEWSAADPQRASFL